GRIMGLANHTLLISKDGSRYHIADSASPINKNDGSLIGVIMVFRDVTGKYEMERALQESETQLRNKLDTIMSPDLDIADLKLPDIIDIEDLQHIQDAFSYANNIASVIIDPEGNNLTKESNSQDLCTLIRKTKKGAQHCFEASNWLRQEAYKHKEPIQDRCKACGLLEAAAPLIIGEKHIGIWIIGQSRTVNTGEEHVLTYADTVGANKEKVKKAFQLMPVLSEEQFNKSVDLLWVLTREISSLGYNNLKLSRDVQEKLRAKKELKLSEERFKTLLQATPDLIFLIKMDGTFQDVFTSDLSRLFMPKDQIIGKKYQEILPSEVAKALSDAAYRANETGTFRNFEYQWIDNKKEYWFSARISRFEVDGAPNLICFVRDITEQRNAEASLRESEEKFRQISEQSLMSIGIIQTGRVVYSNHAYSRLSGYSRDELRNLPEENVTGLIHHEDREFVLHQAQKVLEGKHDAISRFAYRLVSSEGKMIWVDNFFSRIKFNKQPALLVTLVDITEQKKAREQLKQHEAQLNAILNNLPHLAWLKNHEGKFLAVNETLAETAGTTVSEMLNRTDFDIWPQELAAKYVEDDHKVITEKKRIYTEEKVAVKTGSGWFETFKTPVYDQTGEVIGTAGISLDITDRRAASEELRQTKERLENIINTSNAIIYTMSPDGQLTWVSNSWKELLGAPPDTVIGKSYKDLIHDEDIPASIDFFKRVLSKGKRLKGLEFRIKNTQGEWVWFTTTGSRLFETTGEFCQVFLGVATEITTRKHAEEALRESEALYRQIINTSPDAITVTDTEGRIMLISPKVLEMYNHHEEGSIIGRSILEWVAPEEHKRVMEDIQQLMTTDQSESKQYKLVKSTGESFYGEINSAFVRDAKGNPRSMVSITRNITERKKAEAELIHAKEKAEEADRLKSAFLSNMSHEIRTPMNGIIGFSNLLVDEEMSREQRNEYIRIIRNNGKSLMNLIDDIIDFSRIEAGQITIKKIKCDLNNLLNEVYRMFNKMLLDTGRDAVKLKLSLPRQEQLIVETDPARLRQVLNNLTGNAIKFTDRGIVEIGYTLNDNKHINVFVKDTGIGLPPEKAGMIFERFRQIDESHTRRHRGTGLGLAISRHLVNLLGGDIWVDSAVGKGSVFQFTLPFDPGETESITKKEIIKVQTKSEIPDWTNQQVLVAEDEEINFFYLSQLLKKTNIKVIRAKNGSEAVELARKNPDVKLILMDIKMPVLNGYEATKKIKEANPQTIIIAQTAYAMEEEKKKCVEAGCDDYLSKPIEKQSLFEKMNKYLNNI
ncbi:MAG TPA: PAS domain S-box protein, partial [Bacteroidales bacterium]|nr:PAS domain S-box protein [Bacteroidales bacterium]